MTTGNQNKNQPKPKAKPTTLVRLDPKPPARPQAGSVAEHTDVHDLPPILAGAGTAEQRQRVHGFYRCAYYGTRGQINARELRQQMNSCSCHTLMLSKEIPPHERLNH